MVQEGLEKEIQNNQNKDIAFEGLLDLVARKRDSLEIVVKQGRARMPTKLLQVFNKKDQTKSDRHNSEPRVINHQTLSLLDAIEQQNENLTTDIGKKVDNGAN